MAFETTGNSELDAALAQANKHLDAVLREYDENTRAGHDVADIFSGMAIAFTALGPGISYSILLAAIVRIHDLSQNTREVFE